MLAEFASALKRATPPLHTLPRAVTSQRFCLTPVETHILDVCRTAVAQHTPATTVRVAGGWVRDKLLGVASDTLDLDLAVDNLPGVAFATLVNQVLSAQGVPVHTIGVLQARPAQSKHLETATFSVFGRHVDVSHMRRECYTELSRIPVTVTVGTPGEDAQRRDLTINSLFYNINTDTVEDYTGCGFADLAAGVLRTPLPPAETFADDPLRMLRVARFAARFGFVVEPAIVEAARQPALHLQLAQKVSRERFGQEFGKLCQPGSDAHLCLALLADWGALSVILGLTRNEEMRVATAGLACLANTRRFETSLPMDMVAVLAAVLTPLRSQTRIAQICRDALMLSQPLTAATTATVTAVAKFQTAATARLAGRCGRVASAEGLRAVGPRWPMAVAMAAADAQAAGEAAMVAAVCDLRHWLVRESELVGCWTWKPLLDGHSLMIALGLTVGSPLVGAAQRWQVGGRTGLGFFLFA